MSSLPWIDVAESYLGIREIPGPKSNPLIIEMAKKHKEIPAWYNNDDTPWCALFVTHCLIEGGCSVKIPNPLWVPNYNKWGTKCKPVYGCVMNFSSHVAFYISEDDEYYHILGGNQSNAVTITRFPKSHLYRASWPSEHMDLLVAGPVINKNFIPGPRLQ